MSDEEDKKLVPKGAVKNVIKSMRPLWVDVVNAIDQLPAVPDRRRSVEEIERAVEILSSPIAIPVKLYGLPLPIRFARWVLGEDNEWSKLFAEQKGA